MSCGSSKPMKRGITVKFYVNFHRRHLAGRRERKYSQKQQVENHQPFIYISHHQFTF